MAKTLIISNSATNHNTIQHDYLPIAFTGITSNVNSVSTGKNQQSMSTTFGVNGTLYWSRFRVSSNTKAVPTTLTLIKNGVSTGISTTVTAGQTGEIALTNWASNPISVTAGDVLAIDVNVTAATGVLVMYQYQFYFEAASGTYSPIIARVFGGNADLYWVPPVAGNDFGNTSDATTMAMRVPIDCVIRDIAYKPTLNTQAGSSTIRLYVNGVASAAIITVPAGDTSIQTYNGTVSLSAGDLISWGCDSFDTSQYEGMIHAALATATSSYILPGINTTNAFSAASAERTLPFTAQASTDATETTKITLDSGITITNRAIWIEDSSNTLSGSATWALQVDGVNYGDVDVTIPSTTDGWVLSSTGSTTVNAGQTIRGRLTASGTGSANTWGAMSVANEALLVAPVAAFSGTPLTGDNPLSVQFTDASTNTPTSWLWDFGDSSTSTDQNPLHEYASAGTYTVSLTATNAGGSDDEVKIDYVTVTQAPPVANFTGTPLVGTGPLTVQFTDTSTNSPTSWAWDFGDSGTSTDQNPSHVYAAGDAFYTVSLVATNAGGSDTETKSNYINVDPSQPQPGVPGGLGGNISFIVTGSALRRSAARMQSIAEEKARDAVAGFSSPAVPTTRGQQKGLTDYVVENRSRGVR